MFVDLLELFHAKQGIVSCVGAGGKKTTMFRLAEAHAGRVGITATAHIEFFPKTLKATNYIGDEPALLQAIENDHSSTAIAFAKPSERFGRRAGIDIDSVLTFKQAGKFDLMVIKADGARSRFIKAPARHEPAVSPNSDTIIPIMSAKVLGEPLTDQIAHRVDEISQLTGLSLHNKFEPIHLARLMASEHGSLKFTEKAKVVPLINMVDDERLADAAREVAELALGMTQRFDRVVLASMKQAEPVVAVIERAT